MLQNEELQQFYIDQWKARKSSGMSHSKKDWDERAFDWQKELTEEGEQKDRAEERVAQTAAFLRANGQLGPEDEVIDIGCGPGRFVTEFAKTAKHVTGTDISGNMCLFGKDYAASKGIENVSFLTCDFKETDIVKQGWEHRFDLVFSSITPAMSTYESFRKAEQMSRKYCFQSNYVKVDDPLGEEVLSEVLAYGSLVHSRGMSSFLALFNILCLEGGFPVVRFFKESSRQKVPADETLAVQILKNAPAVERTPELIRKLTAALVQRADADGCVERFVEWTYGWMLWDVRDKRQVADRK